MLKSLGTEVEESEAVNFDISSRIFTVTLLITFAFQHFLN